MWDSVKIIVPWTTRRDVSLYAIFFIQLIIFKFSVNASSIGFKYLPEANGCYLAVLDSLNWTQSQARCTQLDPRAHLAVITSEQQNNAIVNYLLTVHEIGNYRYFFRI